MTTDKKEILKKALNIFMESTRYTETEEKTQAFLEWRETLTMLNDIELQYISNLYYNN